MAAHRWRKWFGYIGTGLCVLLLALWVYGVQKTHQAERMYPPIGRFVTVDNVQLHYIARGIGQPVVMIHGSDGVLQDFTLTIFDSVAAFAQAIVFDRPGHGYSERPGHEPLTLELNARLIHDALWKHGIVKPIIVGHSYGGAVALQYAINYPSEVSGLVLLSPAVYADGLPISKTGAKFIMSVPNVPVLGPLLTYTLVAPLFGSGVEAGIKPTFAPNPVNPEYAKIMAAMMPRPKQFRAWADESVHFGSGLDSNSSRYGEIAIPTVIVAGDSDQVAIPEKEAIRLKAGIPGADLVLLGRVGHMVHYARPDAVVDAIRREVHVAQGNAE